MSAALPSAALFPPLHDPHRHSHHQPPMEPVVRSILTSTWHVLDQPPPPTLREILGAYKSKGDGDREMLLTMLNAKSAEDQRIASTVSLHRTMLEMYNTPVPPTSSQTQDSHASHIYQPHFPTPPPTTSYHNSPPLPPHPYSSSHPQTESSVRHQRQSIQDSRSRERDHGRESPILIAPSRKRRRSSRSPPPPSREHRSRPMIAVSDTRPTPPHDLPLSPYSSSSTHGSSHGSPRSRESMAIGSLLSEPESAPHHRRTSSERNSKTSRSGNMAEARSSAGLGSHAEPSAPSSRPPPPLSQPLSPPTPFHLPDELLDHILSFLWDNCHGLKASSLVSHAWHTAARPYIFRSVTLFLEGPGEERTDDLRLMLDATPLLGQWVRELRVVQSRQCGSRAAQVHFWSVWTAERYRLVLGRLKRVCGLVVEEEERFRRNLATWRGSVRALSFVLCNVSSSVLLYMLRLLPHVRELLFSQTEIRAEGEETSFPRLVDPQEEDHYTKLTTLDLYAYLSCTGLYEFLPAAFLQSVEILKCSENPLSRDTLFLLGNVTRHLHTLKLDVPSAQWWGPDERRQAVERWPLEHLTSLRTFSLHIHTLDDAILPPLLLKLTQLPIEQITFQGNCAKVHEIEPSVVHAGLDRVLAMFVALRRFVMSDCAAALPLEIVADRVRRLLPTLGRRGVQVQVVQVRFPLLQEHDYFDHNLMVPIRRLT
ncbi:hypothetical protein EIP91_002380 [Steccherinum ochraceum]|uniref:Uncharacterized protein n=1 Tax=Steccherinum ochraceum TaxID=92696 RepID=A0A4R0RXD0_9APHY|nr:hypothetical protein EIP91_002380 [Steccherinum ochraceum]